MQAAMLGIALVCATVISYLPVTTAQSDSPTYLITCSEYIRPGEDFKVDVNIIGGLGIVHVMASIDIVSTNTGVVTREVTSASMDFDPGQTDVITMTIPGELTADSLEEYRLGLFANGGLTLNEYRTLQLLTKSKSIFVQSDKAVYKPGDLVQFRAFVVDIELRPQPGPLDITIFDPNGNRIAQWLDQNPSSGLFSGQLQLSDHVNLGDWKIRVEHGDDSYEKVIEIGEYVLPRFKVEVILPAYVIVPDQELPITVKATYTYGQPVTGMADILIRRRTPTSGFFYSYQLLFQRRQLEADGMYSMTVGAEDYATLCNPSCSSSRLLYDTFVVEANVTETATGTVLSGLAIPTFTRYGTEIMFMDATPASFKPGFSFVPYLHIWATGHKNGRYSYQEAYPDIRFLQLPVAFPEKVKVTRPDGTPWNVPHLNVTLGGSVDCGTLSGCEDFTIPEITRSVPDNGIITFSIDLTELSSGYRSMRLHAAVVDPETQQNIITQRSISAFLSESNEAIQITQQRPDDGVVYTIQPGTTVVFNVQTTDPVTRFSFQVYSKSHLVQSGSVSTSGTDHVLILEVDVDLAKDMSPAARIIVSYITASGELIADTLLVYVEGAFTNDVSVVYSSEQISPDAAVNIAGRAEPNSIVALLAVDQRVLLLQSGNDITRDEVWSEYASYDAGTSSGAAFCYYCNRGTDVTELYLNNHVIVFTNAIMYPDTAEHVTPRTTTTRFGPALWPSGTLIQTHHVPPDIPSIFEIDIPQDDLAEVTQIRDMFEEAWIFNELNARADGRFSLTNLPVPDTITSWVLSAFALHDTAGLGIANTASLNVFKPFFVSLTLPYSVIRGEMLALKVSVFNYLTSVQDVKITLPLSHDFAVLVNGTEAHSQVEGWIYNIQPQASKTVVIWIRPSDIGVIDIEVHAQSSVAADGVRRTLIVKAEGEPKVSVESVFVIKRVDSAFTHTFIPFFPPDVVPDSERMYVTVIGSIVGLTMANLDQLLQMPTGCGEQTMMGFAPAVFVMQYWTATDQSTSEGVATALRYMDIGYQRELTFKRNDHSYSAFGQRDRSGSTWLTAFVVKTFHQAMPFISIIDEDVIVPSLEWILAQQSSDGSFNRVGRVNNGRRLLGGVSDTVELSAFVTITILECRDMAESTSVDLEAAISSAVAFLEGEVTNLASNMYGLAISAYALALADSPMKAAALDLLNNHAIVRDGAKYWSESQNTGIITIDIEMTAYGLLATLLNDNGAANGIQIAKWLTSKQNEFGGYRSTQDTVVALQAMTQFAIQTATDGEQNLHMAVSSTNDVVQFDTITDANSDILTTIELPTSSPEVVLTTSGSGRAIVKVVTEYNIPVPDPVVNITLDVDIINVSDNGIQLNNCIRLQQDGDNGMVIVSIQAVSGFTNDRTGLMELYADSGLRQAEIVQYDLVLYLDEVPQGETCITTTQLRQHSVTNLKPAIVSAYRYYAPETQANVMYLPDALAGENVTQACPECADYDFEIFISEPRNRGNRLVPAAVLAVLLLAALICFLS